MSIANPSLQTQAATLVINSRLCELTCSLSTTIISKDMLYLLAIFVRDELKIEDNSFVYGFIHKDIYSLARKISTTLKELSYAK